MKNGGVRLGAEGDKANDIYDRLNDVIQAKGSTSSSLKSFAVRDANLTLFDEVTGLNLTAPRADLSITAQGKQHRPLSFNADVNRQPGKPAHVKADLLLPADTGPDQRQRHHQPSRSRRAGRQRALVPAAAQLSAVHRSVRQVSPSPRAAMSPRPISIFPPRATFPGQR